VTAHTPVLRVSGSYTYRYSTTFINFSSSSTAHCHFFSNIYILANNQKYYRVVSLFTAWYCWIW